MRGREVKSIVEIPIDKLVANPHRNIEEYELDEDLVESLMASMNATDVWLGLEARERNDGMYEIAFGHHRLEAAKRIGVKSVVVSVSERSELDMLDMMIQENHARRDLPQMVVLEEVSSAAAYWNELLQKHPDYDTAPDEIKSRIPDKRHYTRAVNEGIGKRFLTDVLGGNIGFHAIQNALEMLAAMTAEHDVPPSDDDDDEPDIAMDDWGEEPTPEEIEQMRLDRERLKTKIEDEPEEKPNKVVSKGALAIFTSQGHAKAFMDEVNDPDVAQVIDVKEHTKLAKRIVDMLGSEMTVKTIKKKIRDIAAVRIAARSKDEAEKAGKLRDYELTKLKNETGEISKQCKKLSGSLSEYTNKLESLGVSERMNGIEVMELSNAIVDVVREIERVAFYVGYNQEEDIKDV